MTSKIIEVTDENFQEEVYDSPIPVIVDFWASWCNPCKTFMPYFEKCSSNNKYTGIKFCKSDVDKTRLSASKHGIRSIPTLVIFKGSNEFSRMSPGGSSLERELEDFLAKLLPTD